MADEEKKEGATADEAPPIPTSGLLPVPVAALEPPPGWVGVARPTHRFGADADGTIWFVNGQFTDAVTEPENEIGRSIILATYRNGRHAGLIRWQ